MDKRISSTLAAAAVVALPLLAGCGSTTTTSPAAPAASSAPATSAAPADASTSPAGESPSPSPTPSSDPAADKKAVAAATTRFVSAALTIGYPDKRFSDYTDRIKPLMTKKGYTSLRGLDEFKEASKTLKTLYGQHARTRPKGVDDDVKVSGLTSDSATAKTTYRLQVQQQRGGDWKSVRTSSKDSVSIKLQKVDGKWLVSDAN